MNLRNLTLVLSLCMPVVTLAQISMGGKPVSGNTLVGVQSASRIPKVELKALDIEKIMANRDTTLLYPTYGIVTDTLIDLKEAGIMDRPAGGGKIWRLKISNENARSVQIYLRRYVVPEGSKLFLYNEGMQMIAGAFTRKNMQPDSSLTIADFKGNHTIIEYYEPESAEFNGEIIIGAIGQAYLDIFETAADDGFVNVNCPEGKNAQLIKHAVARITFIDGSSQGFCSGALLNNTRQDGSPLFLTAHHCLSSSGVASTLVAYFNYEKTCGDQEIISPTITGSTLLTTGSESDYTLLRLNSKPAAEHQPYYAGWNVDGLETDSVTSVHVPFQQYKKVSIDYDRIIIYPYTLSWEEGADSPENSHFVVFFDIGATSGGSSGSPLFNKKNQVIGQLHGGGDSEDLYGRLSYSYDDAFSTLKSYLDPTNTNVKELNGYTPEGNIPDAFFVSDFEQVCTNVPIQFTDYSVFGPYDMEWLVNPPTAEFTDGTSSTSKNPVIRFLNEDVYNVTLNLRVDGVIRDSETSSIISGSELKIGAKKIPSESICDCDFESFAITASGAGDYSWLLNPEDVEKVTLSKIAGDTIIVERNPAYIADSSYSVRLKVAGSQGTCSDTIQFAEKIFKPSNDNMANAIVVSYGRSPRYSNICATEEVNEPVPSNTSCTSQDAWCGCVLEDNTEVDDILDNSVWFKFVPLVTGNISISSTGFDNQIALYKADTYEDLTNGNSILVAANDDRSDADYRPMIISEQVNQGENYWIQVDGSACGAENYFTLTINELTGTGVRQLLSGPFSIYPMPAHDQLWIHREGDQSAVFTLKMYSLDGSCILQEQLKAGGSDIPVSVNRLEPGVYIIMLNDGSTNYISKFIKE